MIPHTHGGNKQSNAIGLSSSLGKSSMSISTVPDRWRKDADALHVNDTSSVASSEGSLRDERRHVMVDDDGGDMESSGNDEGMDEDASSSDEYNEEGDPKTARRSKKPVIATGETHPRHVLDGVLLNASSKARSSDQGDDTAINVY